MWKNARRLLLYIGKFVSLLDGNSHLGASLSSTIIVLPRIIISIVPVLVCSALSVRSAIESRR